MRMSGWAGACSRARNKQRTFYCKGLRSSSLIRDWPPINEHARLVVDSTTSGRMISLGAPPDRGLTCEVGGVEVMGAHVTCWP